MLSSVRRTAAWSFKQLPRSMSTLTENATSESATAETNAKQKILWTKPKAPPPLNIPPANDPLLEYFTSLVQQKGKRARASRLVSRVLLHIYASTRAPPLPILRHAISLASPAVRVVSHRHGGKIVLKPAAIGEKQRAGFALRWIIEVCEKTNSPRMDILLAKEIIAVVQGHSSVLKRKNEVHKVAMLNRGARSY